MKSRSLLATALFTGSAVLAGLPATAFANPTDVIVSPVRAVINSGGPGFGNIEDTLNHNGLVADGFADCTVRCGPDFTSGVTLFDDYIGGMLGGIPLHTPTFISGNGTTYEWFTEEGSTSATVTYDLGRVRSINRLALWNENDSGIGLLDLLWSSDGVNFFSLASNLLPTNHPGMPPVGYAPDTFSFADTDARFVRFEMSRCPQDDGDPNTFQGCAIGEVAFAAAPPPPDPIPEPATLALLGLGLAALGIGRRKLRR
jgi:hypothetical protein